MEHMRLFSHPVAVRTEWAVLAFLCVVVALMATMALCRICYDPNSKPRAVAALQVSLMTCYVLLSILCGTQRVIAAYYEEDFSISIMENFKCIFLEIASALEASAAFYRLQYLVTSTATASVRQTLLHVAFLLFLGMAHIGKYMLGNCTWCVQLVSIISWLFAFGVPSVIFSVSTMRLCHIIGTRTSLSMQPRVLSCLDKHSVAFTSIWLPATAVITTFWSLPHPSTYYFSTLLLLLYMGIHSVLTVKDYNQVAPMEYPNTQHVESNSNYRKSTGCNPSHPSECVMEGSREIESSFTLRNTRLSQEVVSPSAVRSESIFSIASVDVGSVVTDHSFKPDDEIPKRPMHSRLAWVTDDVGEVKRFSDSDPNTSISQSAPIFRRFSKPWLRNNSKYSMSKSSGNSTPENMRRYIDEGTARKLSTVSLQKLGNVLGEEVMRYATQPLFPEIAMKSVGIGGLENKACAIPTIPYPETGMVRRFSDIRLPNVSDL